MKTRSFVIALGIAAGIVAAPAMAAATLLKFEKGIGVDPVAGIAGTPPAPLLNTVKGVNPGGKPWTIAKLKVTVKDDGNISARGEGLVLSAGDAIGTVPSNITQVAATLICGVDRFDSGPAPIDAGGNFKIAGPLSGTPTNPCSTPVLLIRNATGGTLGAWFAAGVPGDDSD